MASIAELGRQIGDYMTINDVGVDFLNKKFDLAAKRGDQVKIVESRGFYREDDKSLNHAVLFIGDKNEIDLVIENDKDLFETPEEQFAQ